MYLLIHTIVPILLIVVLVIFLYKNKHIRKTGQVLIVLLVLGIISFIQCFPPESLFVTFYSAEEAFEYMSNAEILEVISGKESSVVIYQEEPNQLGRQVFARISNGYKLPYCNSLRQIKSESIPLYG